MIKLLKKLYPYWIPIAALILTALTSLIKKPLSPDAISYDFREVVYNRRGRPLRIHITL